MWRGLVVSDGVGDIAERVARGHEAAEGRVPSVAVPSDRRDRGRIAHDPTAGEPLRSLAQARQALDERAVFELLRVQEVEGCLERDGLMHMVCCKRSMRRSGVVRRHVTRLHTLTGYAQTGMV